MFLASRVLLCGVATLLTTIAWAAEPSTVWMASLSEDGNRVEIRRSPHSPPLLTQVAKPDFRPYVHPLVAPDGQGVLTQHSPGHHPHQTGIYWGFTRVNGRDYFHHPEGTYWRRVSVNVLKAEATDDNDVVKWQTVYDLLDEAGNAVLRETQVWQMQIDGNQYVLTVDWSGEAFVDVTVSKYDYGGLFVRMPWQAERGGTAINNARQVNARAEGQRAVWLDVGMPLEGRADEAHITIFDHPQNKGFPQSWRVDSQLGVGPVRARLGDWQIAKGKTELIKHQLVVSTGPLNDVERTQQWSAFSGQGMAYAQWQLAQQEGRRAEFLTPEQAVQKMTLQDGFVASVYAAEPMIGQPMAFCWDAKGRLWVAENHDYETRQTGFSAAGTSRIVILEDTDRDGAADSRKVFLEGIPFPSAMTVGMGGLWLGAPPNLLFIPDKNADDVADMDSIEVRLTGWGIRDRHETLNSLIWGPDGWIYGLQGFATPSSVGKPKGAGKIYRHKDPFPETLEFADTPVEINGGVWRYHPTKERFEVVAHGFSNPWGIDYDAHGQMFITACVIPHLWHVIPGGIYHRQGGTHFNPHVYSDIRTIADHSHQSAHGGARVYQSDAYPDRYVGRIFMANIHEHALLTDILERKGSGFVGKHGDDLMSANNAQWVGFSVEVGPDGNVYVLDWHDADICGKEVLHKQTGRIFKIAPQQSQATSFAHRYEDLQSLDDLELAKLQTVNSVWHATQARVILQHRAGHQTIAAAAIDHLQQLLASSSSDETRLRALWTLHAVNQLAPDQLSQLLADKDEYVRAWSIQLLCEDRNPSSDVTQQFVQMAKSDASPVVRLYLASALQRMDSASAWRLVSELSKHGEDAGDHNLPKMIWFGWEPLVTENLKLALQIASQSSLPMLTRHCARRVADEERFDELLEAIATANGPAQRDLMLGLRDALEGRYDIKSPAAWTKYYPQLRQAGGDVARIALQLSQQFGDSLAAEAMLETVLDEQAQVADRREALTALAGRKRPELVEHLAPLFAHNSLRRDAIRAVGAFEEPALADELLKRYPQFTAEEKMEVIHALATRASYGNELTDAIASGIIPKQDVPAFVARLLRRSVGNRFIDVWGPIESLAVDQEAQLERLRVLLTADKLRLADKVAGRVVFQRTCAACHQMFGSGGQTGPDITGANRSNIEYLLSNIVTPSAIIQDAYRMHIILADDGRIYSGIPVEENERQLKLRVADRDDPVVIPVSQIESREIAAVSMMPEGLLNQLRESEIVDLFGYLQSAQQIPLPVPSAP